ncbi:glycosyltransferase family 2 protein [Pontibacter sp. CAU 1760]
MATAVLDLDIDNLPPEISGLSQYSKAFLLLRSKGRPVGKAILPVQDGCLHLSDNLDQILKSVGPTLWLSQLHDFLGYDEREVSGYTFPKATVAVCTRDRTEDLARCLEALMRLPDLGQEFLVIDNCPRTEDTMHLVGKFPRVRYIREDFPGLNVARNRAIAEAAHDIVAFTDDDATPDPYWLQALLINFSNPLVQCVTGLTMPLQLETEAQECFELYAPFGRGFSRKEHTSDNANPLATGRVGAGANMAIRRRVCNEIGNFDEALDAGTLTHSGGDHDMFTRILTAGYTIVYEPHALSWHRHRRTHEELYATLYGYGVGVYALFTRHLTQDREWGVFKIAYKWFRHSQFKILLKAAMKRPDTMPLKLVFAELKGCLAGPMAYYKSKRKVEKQRRLWSQT